MPQNNFPEMEKVSLFKKTTRGIVQSKRSKAGRDEIEETFMSFRTEFVYDKILLRWRRAGQDKPNEHISTLSNFRRTRLARQCDQISRRST